MLARMVEGRAADPALLPQGTVNRWPGTIQVQGGRLVYLGEDDGLPDVTPESAAGIIAFYRATRIIASTCGAFPVDVYDGVPPKQMRLPVDALLWNTPNPEQTPMQFYELIFGHLASAGNAFIYAPPGPGGLPDEMWPLMPDRVKVGRSKATGRKVYLIDGKIPQGDVSYGGEIIHIPGYGYDGLIGYNPIVIAARAMSLGISAETYAAKLFVNGSPPGAVVTTEQTLDDKQAEAMLKRWEDFHRGLGKAHRLGIIDAGGKYQTVSLDPMTAQLLESRKFTVTEMARLTGIPPYLLADVEKSTSWGTGIEVQGRALITFTLNDYVTRVEQVLTYKLLAGVSRYVKFNMGALLKGSTRERYEAYKVAIDARIMNPNEARAFEDWAPYDGGDEFLLAAGQGEATAQQDEPKPPEDDGSDEDEEA